MKQVHEMGVTELGRALHAREVSSVEATTALLEHLPIATPSVRSGQSD